MNKKEFIGILRSNIKGLSQEETDDIIYDYEEHFQIRESKGKSEEEICVELGDPKSIAKMYKANSTIEKAENDPSTKNLFKAILSATALGIFNFIIVLGPTVVSFFVLVLLYGISISLILGGMETIFNITLGSFFPIEIYLGVNRISYIFFGIGIVGLGLMIIIGTFYLSKLFYKLAVKYLKWNINVIKK